MPAHIADFLQEKLDELLPLPATRKEWPKIDAWCAGVRPIIHDYRTSSLSEFNRYASPTWQSVPVILGPNYDRREEFEEAGRTNDSRAEKSKQKLVALVQTTIRLMRAQDDAGTQLFVGAKPSPPDIPVEITESLKAFRRDHPSADKTAFLMMRFGDTPAHRAITQSVRDVMAEFGIDIVRADDKHYHDDLFPNVLTYIYGSSIGIAVFERLETDDFNPNVSLEVGYMLALRKKVCLLKDRTLPSLHTDLVGKLYWTFDPQSVARTIKDPLRKWAIDKGIVSEPPAE